jgi:hypothetical protein
MKLSSTNVSQTLERFDAQVIPKIIRQYRN